MAALTITPANVLPVNSTQPDLQTLYTAAASITAGQAVALNQNNRNWVLAASDAAATDIEAGAAGAANVGVAVCNAAAGQPIVVQYRGLITFGVTLVVGKMYVVGPQADGAIAPVDDLAATHRPTYLGYAVTAANLQLAVAPTGVVHG